jgi:hypothetical protein
VTVSALDPGGSLPQSVVNVTAPQQALLVARVRR